MTVQNQDIQHVQTENKAKEFERKKELRNQIISFAETGNLNQLTEIVCEIKRLEGNKQVDFDKVFLGR
tara:strand:- start:343 stop:546 length:204 start_codon:yes stop_codon:yes gene_type:complete